VKNKLYAPLSIVAFFLTTNSFANISDGSIFRANRLLAHTINFGYIIEYGKQAYATDTVFEQLKKVKKEGFTAVRLPINWIPAMDSSASWAIKSSFLNIIDEIFKKALSLRLSVILDNQTDEQLMNDPAGYGARIFKLWEQLSEHYKMFSDSLMFEPMAEPHGNLNGSWNMLISELLKEIRVDNPTRPVIVGAINFNRPDFLYQLELPKDDEHIIVSFHQYNPVKFTMQGETWFPFGEPLEWLGTLWPQKDDEDFLIKMFDRVNAWAESNHRPVFMGEFGVSSKADIASASRWIAFNRNEAEKRGFAWGFWSCFGIEFSLYNAATLSWNTKFIEALTSDLNQIN
jgi:endoglucanase